VTYGRDLALTSGMPFALAGRVEIQFLGAAQTVTGSRHLLTTDGGARILLDCGLFQGRRHESIARNQSLGLDAAAVDAVVLSHAHIDHSGALPILIKNGFRGPIYATPATRDLCAAMLMDAANLQAADARYINHRIRREGAAMEPVEPLYDERHVLQVLAQMTSLPYRHRAPIAGGVQVTFLDAGHVLGSAITVLDVGDAAAPKRLAFTGDLGRKGVPILRDPEPVDGVQVLLSESTYGDRLHEPYPEMEAALADVIARVRARGGKVIVPSFALERAQEIVYALKGLRRAGRLPRIPVYVDSPLTVQLTDVFRLHPECFDDDARALIQSHDSPFDFDDLRYISSADDSIALDANPDPCVVIAASGMCEGGRVVHHLRRAIEDDRNCVLIVGFQAEHTLGRRLVERRPRVRIFGVERDLRAEVVVLAGFSAHADQRELVEYAEETRRRGPLREVILVHGEPAAQTALRAQLEERAFPTVRVPGMGDVLRL
jgi:metallo-beta-lactamase family protein